MPQNSSEVKQAKFIWNETASVLIANDFWHGHQKSMAIRATVVVFFNKLDTS